MIRAATLRLNARRGIGRRDGVDHWTGLTSAPTLAGIAGGFVCVAAFALTVSGSASSLPVLAGVARTLSIAVPIGVGVFTWQRHPDYPFGRLLVAAGFAWALTALAESGNEVLYSLGRVSAWLVEPTLLIVLLAFPFARLHGTMARALVGAAIVVVLTLYLPTALMVHQYPLPTPYAACGTECPANAFMVTDHQPAIVNSVMVPVREAITSLLFLGAVLLLAWRTTRASRAARRVAVPVLAMASARLVLFPAYLVARRANPDSTLVEGLAWAFTLTLSAIALAFLSSILRWKLFLAGALERVTAGLAGAPGSGRLRRSLAEALERPVPELPPPAYTGARTAADRLATLVHDPNLNDYPGLLEATGSLAGLALDNDRLAAELHSSLRELHASRSRIQSAADSVRRDIERDLHDGAQQHLVTLQMRLELAIDLLDTDREASRRLLREVGNDAEEALDGVRSLAHGVYPAILVDRGVADALRSAARRSPRPITLRAPELGRFPEEVESAVYFCCLEAIQNATKHAGEGASVTVSLTGGPDLRFEVHDDGVGFDTDAADQSSGLTNMRDRIETAGGILVIHSLPGEGTTVMGVVPSC